MSRKVLRKYIKKDIDKFYNCTLKKISRKVLRKYIKKRSRKVSQVCIKKKDLEKFYVGTLQKKI